MGLFTSETRKGSLQTAKGEISFKQSICARSVDEQQRHFQIILTDENEKKFTINVYGDDINELQRIVNIYMESRT